MEMNPVVTYTFGADLGGSPALGPTAFMHRESARSNPQAPLTHHDLDSTHITPHEPEWFDPFDVTRLTAAVGFNRSRLVLSTRRWPGASTASPTDSRTSKMAISSNPISARPAPRPSTAGPRPPPSICAGSSLIRKDSPPAAYSDVKALTLGYLRDLPIPGTTRFGIGGDARFYRTSSDLLIYYGGSHSYHVFLRWPPGVASAARVH